MELKELYRSQKNKKDKGTVNIKGRNLTNYYDTHSYDEVKDSNNSNFYDLRSDYQQLLSKEEKKIQGTLNKKSNDTEISISKNTDFYNLSLKEIVTNFLVTWNNIILDMIYINKNFKKCNQDNNTIYKQRYWWTRFKNILDEVFFIFTQNNRLIYVGIMLIIISFFIYFILLSS
jgi:hypothetical protein